MSKFNRVWQSPQKQSGVRYICGYCGTDTTPSSGWESDASGGHRGYILLCTNCNKPSFIEMIGATIQNATPAAMLGRDVEGLPEDVQTLYDEARRSTSVGSYTSAVLTCRKILMHVAVEKGAKEGLGFIQYVEYLAANSYIPPDGKDWVDHIRSKSNEANHEITIMGLDEAQDLVSFTEMLLRLVYEFKHRLKRSEPPQPGSTDA
jgi:hypothetical protein